MTKLTPKGMRDIAPIDMYIREEVISKIRRIFKIHGFRPIDTPVMEYLETLKAKAGAEVEKQIFVIDGNEYGLRFDLTVPLARFAAFADVPKPFKRYVIDKVWRKEEPQRGRFREFYQADADIVGSKSMRAEAELLKMAFLICNEFGFEKPKILINSRKIIDGILSKFEIVEQKEDVCRALDKLDKVGEVEVMRLLQEILGRKASDLNSIVMLKGSNLEKIAVATNYSKEGADELKQIIELCPFDLEVDLCLVRGLGYYSGTVYEIKLSENIGTVISGGRYDNLIGIYGQDSAAVGISVGIERLITLILENKKTNQKKTETKVFVASVNKDFYQYSQEVVSKLRENGIESETDINERSLKAQFEYINALEIPFAIVIGKKEVESTRLTLRDMKSGMEDRLLIESIIQLLKEKI